MKISEISLVENERILMRLCRKEDADDLKDLFDSPLTKEQTEMMINHFMLSYKEGKEANLAIVDKERDQVVGILSLYDIRQDNSLAIGYRVKEDERNLHYATDAVSLISPFLIENFGASVIRASAHTSNLASVNVLTDSCYRLAAQQSGVLMFIYDNESIARMRKVS